jgi:hypothetical protein
MALPTYGMRLRNVLPRPVAARKYFPFFRARSASFIARFCAFVSATFFCRAAARLTTPAAAYVCPADWSAAGPGGRGALGEGVTV